MLHSKGESSLGEQGKALNSGKGEGTVPARCSCYHGVGKGPGVCGGLGFLPDTQRGFAVPCPSYCVEEPAALAELQKNEWDPIVAWAEKR